MNLEILLSRLLNRKNNSHKGNYGRVGVLAGSESMLGAAQLTSFSALKLGSGLVYLYSVKEALTFIKSHPELIINSVITNTINKDSELLDTLIQKNKLDVLAVGPGLGVSDYVKTLILKLINSLQKKNIPAVIDADGLTCLQGCDWSLFNLKQFVLSPHVGEFKRLFPDLDYDERLEVRKTITKKAAQASNQIVVLKGFDTVVSNGDDVYVNTTGNPSMATAGSGDVLTGIISSLIGQGFSLYEASCLGVYLHGRAGDKAHEELSISLTASNIIDYLQYVL